MNKQTGYLSIIGRVATPAAMVVFMAHEITISMAVTGWWSVFVLFGAILTAVGVEIVGILSGSTLEGFWRRGNVSRSVLSFFLLLIYTASAIYILRHNSTILPIPIVAAVVYIVSALSDSLVIQEQRQEIIEQDDREWERGQIEKDRDLDRQLRIADKKLKHEEELEKKRLAAQVKIERAKSVNSATQKTQTAKAIAESTMLYECSCGKVYEKPQSYSAHTRHCEIHKELSTNGHR